MAKAKDKVAEFRGQVAKLLAAKTKAKAKRDETQEKVNAFDKAKKDTKAYIALFERLQAQKSEVKDITAKIKTARAGLKAEREAQRAAKVKAKGAGKTKRARAGGAAPTQEVDESASSAQSETKAA